MGWSIEMQKCIQANDGAERLRRLLSEMRRKLSKEEFVREINMRNLKLGWTPLNVACACGDVDCVRLLLEEGADPHLPIANKYAGESPMRACVLAAGIVEDPSVETYVDCMSALMKSTQFASKRFMEQDHDLVRCIVSNGVDNKKDRLKPMLDLLLLSGFPIQVNGVPDLFLALENGHFKCALSLIGAGASIFASAPGKPTAPKQRLKYKTCLEESLRKFGENKTSILQKEYLSTRCFIGPTRLQRWLQGGKADRLRLAKRHIKASKQLLAVGAFSEACSALWNAYSFGREILTRKEIFLVLYDLVGLAGTKHAGHRAHTFIMKEFPNDPMAQLQHASYLLHPNNPQLDDTSMKRVNVLIRVVEYQLEKGTTQCVVDTFAPGDIRKRLDHLKKKLENYEKRVQSPISSPIYRAEREANAALFEANIGKVATVVERIQQGGHKLSPYLRFSRGIVLRQRAHDVVVGVSEDLSTVLKDPSSPLAASSSMEATKLLEMALQEFEFLERLGSQGVAAEANSWHLFLTSVSLGRSDNLRLLADRSMKARLQKRRDGLDLSCLDRDGVFYEPHLMGEHMSLELSRAFRARRIEIVRSAVVKMQSSEGHDRQLGSILRFMIASALKEGVEARIACESLGRVAVSPPLKMTLDRIKETGVEEKMQRSQFASMLLGYVDEVQSSRLCSSRILGRLVHEAISWDPEVELPEHLRKAYKKFAPPVRCFECGASKPPKSCPCKAVHFCDEECQAKGWERHKPTCATVTRANKTIAKAKEGRRSCGHGETKPPAARIQVPRVKKWQYSHKADGLLPTIQTPN
ncbi:expressed unknown protein [Seminavis robusta]|uniref:MYND-type domain-containing protein n=1 Tax=Seminavis robusta TaxID=568900 RepID=A0A9N8DCM9_9STRA|nr:expressed unknown protein [Seminavis robusta]|eukprot:Sro35_g022620.1 n/a (809) ;mRNA; r:145276-147702